MAKALKSVPAYAAHLNAKMYTHWSEFWKYFGYELTELKSPEDAAAFLMIAAVEADAETSMYLTYNDGRSIQPCAALPKYRADVAVPGMEIALTRLFNLEAHGANAFNNLVQVAVYSSKCDWTGPTVEKFLDVITQVPVRALAGHENEAPSDQSPYFEPALNILQIAEGRLNLHPDDHVVKDKLVAFCRRAFVESDPAAKGVRLLAMNMAKIFEQHASDADIQSHGPRARALTRITPEYQYFPAWVENCPRLFGPNAPAAAL